MSTPEATLLQSDNPAWDLEAYQITVRGEHAIATPKPRPACPLCQGTGQAAVNIDGCLTTGRCRCVKLFDRIDIFNRAGIPSRYAHATLQSFVQNPDGSPKLDLGDGDAAYRALGTCTDFVSGFDPSRENRGLVLHGDVGRGKTHLMIAMLRELVFQHGVEVRFIEFSRLLSLLKEGYSAGRSDAQVLGSLGNVPVLAIDELGKGRLSDWELAIIDEVVSRRYNSMGCTLATTNYAPGEPSGNQVMNLATQTQGRQNLGDRVGERVYSRLLQLVDFLHVEGRDHRKPIDSGA